MDPFEKAFLDHGPPSDDCIEGWKYGDDVVDGDAPGTTAKPDKKDLERKHQRDKATHKDTAKRDKTLWTRTPLLQSRSSEPS